MVHDDREDGPEQEADERDGDAAADERRHEPHDELEPEREQDVQEDDARLAELRSAVQHGYKNEGGKEVLDGRGKRQDEPSC